MPVTHSSIIKQIQDHLQGGLLLVVGSGVSAAEGIPGMSSLAAHIKTEIPKLLINTPDPAWNIVVKALDAGDHLEAAMGKANLAQTTVDYIVEITAVLIRKEEEKVISRVLKSGTKLPFAELVSHLFKVANQFHVITPNYDRLIEFAAESAGIGVDSRMFGYLHGFQDSKRSADAHRESYFDGRTPKFRSKNCLCVHKPHGSLDWYEVNGKVIRTPLAWGQPPLIITPGIGKYRESFKVAFSDQRTAGNRAADTANRLLFLGYGFNDDHLEHYLCSGQKLTKPSVIVARCLSANARKIISNSKDTTVVALSAVSESDDRTRISTSAGDELIVSECLWRLDAFNKGIIQ